LALVCIWTVIWITRKRKKCVLLNVCKYNKTVSRPRKKGRIAFLRTLLKEPLPGRESALVARYTETVPAICHE
jgi:hypothetical protein